MFSRANLCQELDIQKEANYESLLKYNRGHSKDWPRCWNLAISPEKS